MIPWTVVYRASLSMGFFRQEYWSGLPFPSLGDLPDPGIEPRSPALQADALPSEPPGNCDLRTWLSKCQSLSHVQLFVTPWTVACQDPLTMEFSRQEYWSGLLFPSLGDLPDPGIKPMSPPLAGGLFTTAPPEMLLAGRPW